MFKLTWQINGRTVPSGRLAEEFTKAIKSDVMNEAARSVGEVRCPVHGTHPSSVRVREEGRKLRFEYEACCEELTAAVEAAFQEGEGK
jgi:hypothetical protein